MAETTLPPMLQPFATIRDHRLNRRKRHQLVDILVIAVCATICGTRTWEGIEAWGNAKIDWLKTFLSLPNDIPSHDTFARVFALLDPDEFTACFNQCIAGLCAAVDLKHIAIDGKTLRRSLDRAAGKPPLHLVSAWATEAGILLGQEAVASKSNEITAIPELLKVLCLKDTIVTIDAMGCQKAIAEQIIFAGGDYILALKGNQEQIHADVKAYFDLHIDSDFTQVPYSYYETHETGHGREEERHYYLLRAPTSLRQFHAWLGLQTIGLAFSRRLVEGKWVEEYRYFLCSIPLEARLFGERVRGHWGIENELHWLLDVAFREDESRTRAGYAAQNLALVRRLALMLVRHETSFKVGTETKCQRAGWENEYLLRILSGFLRDLDA